MRHWSYFTLTCLLAAAGCAWGPPPPPVGATLDVPIVTPPAIPVPTLPPATVPPPATAPAIAPPPVSPLAVPPAIVDAPVVAVENPVFLPTGDRQAAWEQIVDVVQQFGFKVDREQPVRQIGDVLTEGRLDTYPRVGATVLEPWRSDSASRQQRLEATLQSIQRRVTLIVRPANGGLLVDVAVLREREVLDRAEFSTTGAGAFRRGDRSPRNVGSAGFAAPRTIAWVPLGRDPALEQSLVAGLKSRFGGSWPAYAAGAASIPAETMQAPEPQRLPPTNPVN